MTGVDHELALARSVEFNVRELREAVDAYAAAIGEARLRGRSRSFFSNHVRPFVEETRKRLAGIEHAESELAVSRGDPSEP